ncbi:MAG TPA: hypothetical protein VM368_07240 [Flavisolibacter sp.]|nr:hypothetical protein [Flavisolibacter sp.]
MDKDNQVRPESYPKPTETDSQLHNQAEFIDQQPNDFNDKSISDLPVNNSSDRQSNDPDKDINSNG